MRGVRRKIVTCVGVLCLVAMTASAMPAPPWSPAEISVIETPTGYKFANKRGVPFFTNDRDQADGKVGCDDECIGIAWLPVFSRGYAKPQGDWSIVIRADKSTQWAYKGKPVYDYFVPEEYDQIIKLAEEDGHWHQLQP